MILRKIVGTTVIGFILLFTLAPIVIIIANSFTESSILTWPPVGFSMKWFVNFLRTPNFINGLIVSIKVATISSFLSLLMGFGAALAIDRYSFRFKNFVDTFLISPLMVPLIIIGIALLQFLSVLGVSVGFSALIIGHVIICMPFVVKTLRASLLLLDRAVEEAALSLGASPYKVLIRITIPMMKSGILASVVFSFIYSFNNLSVSIFLASPRLSTLPVEVWAAVEGSADPTVLAISTFIIGVTFCILILIQKLTGFERFM
jgi:putative spermidine/putrescine transport system permease protein